jgi:hypothetical protein
MRIRLALLFLISTISNLSAGMAAWDSYAVPSRDGSRLLVMRALSHGQPVRSDRNKGTYKLPDGRSIDMSSTFPSSGVYDASTFQPLWKLDDWVSESNLALSEDFAHMAQVNRYSVVRGGTALVFFHQGAEIRRYKIDKLLRYFDTAPFLERSTDLGYPLEWVGDFHAKGNVLHLSTATRRYTFGYREAYRFDLATGKMLSSRIHAPWSLLGIPLIAVVWIGFARRRRHRRNPPISPE